MTRMILVLSGLALLGACEDLGKKKTTGGQAPASGAVTAAEPGGMAVTTAGSKPAAHPAPSDGARGLSGVVLETIDAGKYTYVQLAGAGGASSPCFAVLHIRGSALLGADQEILTER